jgi:hypothetical protein
MKAGVVWKRGLLASEWYQEVIYLTFSREPWKISIVEKDQGNIIYEYLLNIMLRNICWSICPPHFAI